ncbi:hypothetical protein OAN61_00270 [bacterium]|nr:hypothetical protein [bacterium]
MLVVTQGYARWHLSQRALGALTRFDITTQAMITGWAPKIMARKRTFSLEDHNIAAHLKFLNE